MRLYILRHGKAAKRGDWDGDDAERPLTRNGVDHAERTVAALRPLVAAHEILTSPWTRARQTAEIASAAWRLPLREVPWLAGDAAIPADIATYLAPRADVVLVGHEPDLGALVAFLSGGRVELKKCGFAVLEGDPVAQGMRLVGLLTPRLIGNLG
jgi:phosphohistidine phosphatase SixA